MFCPNCDLRVETHFDTVTRYDEALRYKQWFDNEDIRGNYHIEDVGEVIRVNGKDRKVTMRVDICANCAVPIDARTFVR